MFMSRQFTKGQQKWLQAGFNILAKSGPDAITLDSLGERLDLSKGSFYHHFENRDDFLNQLVFFWESSMTDWVIDTTELESENHGKRLSKLAQLTSRAAAMPVERAIRHWARQNSNVKKALKRVEKKRSGYLHYLLIEAGVDEPLLVSRIIYSIFIGVQYLNPPTTDKEMLKMYEQIIPLNKKKISK